jgi:hypothetical protein
LIEDSIIRSQPRAQEVNQVSEPPNYVTFTSMLRLSSILKKA